MANRQLCTTFTLILIFLHCISTVLTDQEIWQPSQGHPTSQRQPEMVSAPSHTIPNSSTSPTTKRPKTFVKSPVLSSTQAGYGAPTQITPTLSTNNNETPSKLTHNKQGQSTIFGPTDQSFSTPWTDDDMIDSPGLGAGNSTRSYANSVSESSHGISPTSIINASHRPTKSRAHAVTTHEPFNQHPLLIFSMRYEIRFFNLSTITMPSARSSPAPVQLHTPPSTDFQTIDLQQVHQHPVAHHHQMIKPSKTLIGGLKNTIGLDFYYTDRESFIFWIDVVDERIYRGTIVNSAITNVDIVVQTGLATAEGLAIDWIGLNIYWVESTLDHIEVSNMNGTFRKTLIAGDMDSPRAIAVDPRFGLIFWTDWDKRVPRITRATMSGEERTTLVYIKEVKGGWPNGLTLDYESKKIYWIDASSDSIHNVDYDGQNHQSILKNVKLIGHPFSIALFESNLFWTDWKTNSVSIANKLNGGEPKELQRLNNRLFDIKVFHKSRQPRITDDLNPCHHNNGNCSHLCLLSKDHTRRCDCPNLMKLSSDNLTCQRHEFFLLIGRANEIRAVDINEPLHHIMAPISVPKVFNPRQFAYDARTRSIFWVDSQTNEVKRAPIEGNNIETIIDVIIDSPSGLALDWISGNIYVTSAPQQKSSGKIFVSNLNGEFISILMDSNQGIISPKSLAINPLLGLLFCIDENESSEPIIFASGMDGKNKRIIASKINNPQLENPSNLAMDYDLNRVYWINQARNSSDNASIQYYDITEDRIITLLDESYSSSVQKLNPGVLCIDGEDLIMSGRAPSDVIVNARKNNLLDRTIHKTQNMDQILALQVFNASSQVGSNACSSNNGNCSQLCVPTNATHRTCKCTMGYSTSDDKDTECIGKSLFLIFSYHLGMKGISIDPSPSQGPEEHFLPPIHKAFRASSIDYVHKDNLIYWVDNEEGSITRINRDTTNYKVVVQGLESEESIAIDWVAGNIYWLDPYYDVIEVARLDGSNRYVIVSGDMDKANGIVVNPLAGYIVWSDTGSYPKIETANLDGTNRRVIISKNLSHIDDLTIDYLEDYIYWIDSSTIERIKHDGSNHQLIHSNPYQNFNRHLVSVAVYENYLFFADSVQSNGSIIRCDKNNASDKQVLAQNLGDGIRDITIYAPKPMPLSSHNPCAKDNGNCQDLCLFLGKPGTKRCICSHGKLKLDGLTCEPYDTFVLYSKLSQIESLHIKDNELSNNSPYKPIAIENRNNVISLTVDYNASRVIYSELTLNQICSVFFNGTDKKILVENQLHVEGIAFANNQLYWTSMNDNSITRLNTTSNGELKVAGCHDPTISCTRHSDYVEKIVRLSVEDKLRGIAVDSCTNYVYWTNWGTNLSSIQRAGPRTGYKVETIIRTNILVPNGIAIDQKRHRIYWCDARLDKIESCDMDGSDRIILTSAAPQHPFAITVWDNYVFWTDWLARGVFRADKYTGQQSTSIKKVVQRPMGIAIAAPDNSECQPDKCLIDNGGCEASEVCKYRAATSEVQCLTISDYLREFRLPHLTSPKNYHDILFDKMDRYNLTEWSTKPAVYETDPPVRSVVVSRQPAYPSDSRQSYDTSSQLIPRISTAMSGSSETPITGPATQSTTDNTLLAQPLNNSNVTVKPPIESTLPHKLVATQSTPSPNPKLNPDNNISSTLKPMAPTSVKNDTQSASPAPKVTETTNATVTQESITKLPLTNTSQIPQPCQITPAALHPTTNVSSFSAICETQDKFACYLSDQIVCISKDKRCDGNHDCPSKEDENDCFLSKGPYNLKRESNWHRFVTVILIILGAAVAALFLVFGTRGRRRWFVTSGSSFNHRRMFDDSNGTNIEISNPMFDEDNATNLGHCPFSIDLNERTTNFSNPLYERQVLLMNDKHVTSN